MEAITINEQNFAPIVNNDKRINIDFTTVQTTRKPRVPKKPICYNLFHYSASSKLFFQQYLRVQLEKMKMVKERYIQHFNSKEKANTSLSSTQHCSAKKNLATLLQYKNVTVSNIKASHHDKVIMCHMDATWMTHLQHNALEQQL